MHQDDLPAAGQRSAEIQDLCTALLAGFTPALAARAAAEGVRLVGPAALVAGDF